jgi:hypothetical protein
MIDQVKKIGLILTIAVLFTVFVFAMTNAVYEDPEYSDYCKHEQKFPYNKPEAESCPRLEQIQCDGIVEYEYGDDGCPIESICNNCNEEYRNAEEIYRSVLF